jgi:hypothetical protein
MPRDPSGRPAFDPWLSHLRRDRRGLPVPYVNRWGGEDVARLSVAYDRHAQGRAVFLDDSAELEPDFTAQNMGRQRECMATGRCQVCHRPIPWSRRNLVVAPLSVEWISMQGRQVPVIFEPWLDDRCADIAVNWCPALIRRRRDEQLTVVPIRSQREVQLVVSTGWVEGPLEVQARADPAAMWCKVALLSHRIERAPSHDRKGSAGG